MSETDTRQMSGPPSDINVLKISRKLVERVLQHRARARRTSRSSEDYRVIQTWIRRLVRAMDGLAVGDKKYFDRP